MATTHPAEHLRLILRQVPGAIWATDTELRLTYVHGQPPMLDDAASLRLIGTTIYDFVKSHDPTEPVIAHHLAALVGGRQSFQYQRRGRMFDVQIEPLRDDHGRIVGCVGAAIDVTERHDAEVRLEQVADEATEKLRRTVSLLESTLDATADGILVVDPDGMVTAFNRQFLKLWKIAPPPNHMTSDRMLLSEVCNQLEEPQSFLDRVQTLYASREEEAFDELRFKDGRIFERYSMPQTVGHDVVGRVWSFRDVTAREQLLRRATFLAGAARLLASLDVEKALKAVVNLAVPDLGDRCAIDLIEEGSPDRVAIAGSDMETDPVPELHPSVLAGHQTTYTVGGRSQVGIPLISRDTVIGALTLVAAKGRTFNDADRELLDELGQRIALSIDNARLYEGARHALNSRDEFLSIAAHEIRGPLTSLHMAVQGLLRGALSKSAAESALGIIERADRRLGTFVDELLDLGRIRTGQLHFHLEEVNLGTVVRDAVSRLSSEITQSGSVVTVHTEGNLVGEWDRFRLEQVVINLLTNAIKYGEGRPIEVSAIETGKRVCIRVADHGIGIDPSMLTSIFDPFQRAVAARHYGGLGLGLHIARTIVEGLGGTISVDSHQGAGATFVVDLPIRAGG
jgi:PAS domain S-box-containing protein